MLVNQTIYSEYMGAKKAIEDYEAIYGPVVLAVVYLPDTYGKAERKLLEDHFFTVYSTMFNRLIPVITVPKSNLTTEDSRLFNQAQFEKYKETEEWLNYNK